MARLSLTPQSVQRVAEWKAKAKPEDIELVARVLEWASEGLNGIRFYCTKDDVDKSITFVQPRDHLYVLVRMRPLDLPDYPNQFEVLNIFEDPSRPEYEPD
ncbi:hypothetical protein [Nonomuraea sp. NPDC049646]|uniref:hypothetical protein n=1 Tax=unclassified Nonomuraea TaxID=2593643 RepID=UPI0037B3601F